MRDLSKVAYDLVFLIEPGFVYLFVMHGLSSVVVLPECPEHGCCIHFFAGEHLNAVAPFLCFSINCLKCVVSSLVGAYWLLVSHKKYMLDVFHVRRQLRKLESRGRPEPSVARIVLPQVIEVDHIHVELCCFSSPVFFLSLSFSLSLSLSSLALLVRVGTSAVHDGQVKTG